MGVVNNLLSITNRKEKFEAVFRNVLFVCSRCCLIYLSVQYLNYENVQKQKQKKAQKEKKQNKITHF